MDQQSKQFEQFLRDNGLEGIKKFYSVYFGVVVPADTESDTNTLLVKVPEVFGLSKVIPAKPRGIPSGKGWGYNFVPKPGETVLITFRFGSPRFPLWEPGFYAKGEKPSEFNDNIIGHKYRDGAISIYDEENHEFRISTVNGSILTQKDDIVSFIVPEGIEFKVEKDNFQFTLANGDIFKYTKDSMKITLASGPKIEFGTSGVQLAGHGLLQHAVLGEPLVTTLTSLMAVIGTIVPILTSHDALVGNVNSGQIGAITTSLSQITSSLNSILAT